MPMVRNMIAKYKAKHVAKDATVAIKRTVTIIQGSMIQERPITWL
jgi:hypothetical protein